MKAKEQAGYEMPSRAVVFRFYTAISLSILAYAVMLCLFLYLLMGNPNVAAAHPQLITVLASANGLLAAMLTLRRKVYGAYLSVISLLLVCLAIVVFFPSGPQKTKDLIAAGLIFSAPAVLLLSQISYVRKLQKTGSGWALKIISNEIPHRQYAVPAPDAGTAKGKTTQREPRLFFGPKWMSKNEQKALRAVEEINNQEELFRVATKARLVTVRIAAIAKLKDLELLILVREKTPTLHVGRAAHQRQEEVIKEIRDEHYLAEAAERMPDMRMLIAEQVTDPIAYSKILKCIEFDGKGYSGHCDAERKAKALVVKLEDQQLLLDIALHAKDEQVCRAAAEKLADPGMKREYVARSDNMYLKKKLCSHEWKPASSKAEKDPCRTCVHCGDSLYDHKWIGVDGASEERCVTCGVVREAHLFAGWSMIPGTYKSGNGSTHDSGYDTWRESATCSRCGAAGERGVAE